MTTYPSNVATVIVTGYWETSDGRGPATGIVTFVPNVILQDGTSTPAAIILPKPKSAVLINGAISVELMATDDSHLAPANWYYTVTENLTGQPNRSYNTLLPAATSPVDLTAVTPVTTLPTPTAYVQASAVGASSGVASLDASGHVPQAQLATAIGISLVNALIFGS